MDRGNVLNLYSMFHLFLSIYFFDIPFQKLLRRIGGLLINTKFAQTTLWCLSLKKDNEELLLSPYQVWKGVDYLLFVNTVVLLPAPGSDQSEI